MPIPGPPVPGYAPGRPIPIELRRALQHGAGAQTIDASKTARRLVATIVVAVLLPIVIGAAVVVLAVVSGESPTPYTPGPRQTYGDDADLDALWDACAAGGWASCDQLYRESPIDSPYEDFGSTCGDRVKAGTWGGCVVEMG